MLYISIIYTESGRGMGVILQPQTDTQSRVIAFIPQALQYCWRYIHFR